MKNYDIIQHVKGQSQFVDDLISPEGLLYSAVHYSKSAHGEIINIDLEKASRVNGVKHIFTWEDIPGENQIGGIIQDEELFAKNKVEFIGQPIALVVADSYLNAKLAFDRINVEIKKLPAIFSSKEAAKKGNFITPPRTFRLGNVDESWSNCDFIIEGNVESGGQEHLYLETQSAVAFPVEGGGIKILSSTQSPTTVQKTASKVLNLPMHKIEVDVLRLGGGFGGKEDQATAWAVMTGLAAMKLNKPVKLILPRHEDMILTGKRHPYSSDFKIGLSTDGKIQAYEVSFFQNAGAFADLSPAILERTLFHCTNSYFIPNVKATAYSCKTNLTPNTAFRGFGAPQAMFVLECAIYKAAEKMNVDASVIQEANLLNENDEFPYGQKAKNSNAKKTWNKANDLYKIEDIKNNIKMFNSTNDIYKKGFAIMPICFGISFTNTFMNQASALVHIYSDGSVSISTAAIEMGQGVNDKIRRVAASVFSINIDRVKIETTNTTRVANTSPTAASSAADLNGKATEKACEAILSRLKNCVSELLKLDKFTSLEIIDECIVVDSKITNLKWEELVKTANLKRIDLSEHAFYATPNINFDKSIEKGNPFAYHVYGTAIIEATVDCLRGTYRFDSVKVVHDFGKSFNPIIDRGQAEGAIVQGLGWMSIEEILHDENGKLLTDTLSTYKVPDIHFTPNIEIDFLEGSENLQGIFKSKAIGEPPFMYGIGGYFALLNAMKAFRENIKYEFNAPLTPEKVLLTLYKNI